MYEAASAFCLLAFPFGFAAFGSCHQLRTEGVLRKALVCPVWFYPIWCSGEIGTINSNMTSWLKKQHAYGKQSKNRFSFICSVSPISLQMDGTSGMLKKTEVRPTDQPDVSRLPRLTNFKPLQLKLVSTGHDCDLVRSFVAMMRD